jgi:hypothetical protein
MQRREALRDPEGGQQLIMWGILAGAGNENNSSIVDVRPGVRPGVRDV